MNSEVKDLWVIPLNITVRKVRRTNSEDLDMKNLDNYKHT